MKNTFILLLTLVIAITSSCTKNNSTNLDTTKSAVMFVPASTTGTGLSAVFAFQNNIAMSEASNLAPLAYTKYFDLPNGTIISYHTSGSANKIAEEATIGSNKHYSFFLYGPFDTAKTKLVEDNLIIPPSGSSKVRFVNFCKGNSRLNCSFNGNLIDQALTYESVDQFIQITSGMGRLQLVDATNISIIATIENQLFESGKLYTVIFTSSNAGGGISYKLTVINNF